MQRRQDGIAAALVSMFPEVAVDAAAVALVAVHIDADRPEQYAHMPSLIGIQLLQIGTALAEVSAAL